MQIHKAATGSTFVPDRAHKHLRKTIKRTLFPKSDPVTSSNRYRRNLSFPNDLFIEANAFFHCISILMLQNILYSRWHVQYVFVISLKYLWICSVILVEMKTFARDSWS